MLRFTLPACICAAVLLAGCATSPSNQQASAPAAAPATAAPTMPPVVIPASAARRVVLTMTGPRAVTEAKDWPEFKREWRETFAEHAKGAGVVYDFVETGLPLPQGEGTLVQVTVNDYRLVGIGSRIFFGVMTGNAYIDARIRFADLRNGTTFGEQHLNTSSSAWGGIVAKVTPQQVDSMATEVFKAVKAAR